MIPEERIAPWEECAHRVRVRRPRVCVIGDFMLDSWWRGSVRRLAREAPVPVVELETRIDAPGGAGNTAVNAARLGARTRAIGAIGADPAGVRLIERLENAGVHVPDLIRVSGARTTTKERIGTSEALLIRLDREQREGWTDRTRAALLHRVRAALPSTDAMLICDYGGRLLSDSVIAALADLPRPPLLVVDAHEPARWRALHPDIVTPNAAEAERTPGVELGSGPGRVGRAVRSSRALRDALGAATVVVTLDRSGTVLLRGRHRPFTTTARPAPEEWSSGAGDVFVAALTVARAAGAGLEAAAGFAQRAADVSTGRSGTCICSLDEVVSEARVPAGSAILGRGACR